MRQSIRDGFLEYAILLICPRQIVVQLLELLTQLLVLLHKEVCVLADILVA